MYLAFDSEVHVHETVPPLDTNMFWILSSSISKVVPSTTVFINTDQQVIEDTKQMLHLYEFETVPEVLAYCEETGTWQTIVGSVLVLTASDGTVLKDSNNCYLLARKGVQ